VEKRYQRMIVALPVDEYQKLVTVATRATREPEQQVLHYIRRALSHIPKPEEVHAT
jgi:hypothetical protein